MENRDVLKEEMLSDYAKVEDKLRIRLVRKKWNDKFYRQGPYMPHPIGVKVLYVKLEGIGEDAVSVHVTDELADRWGIPKMELFETALKNTQSEEQVRFSSLYNLDAQTEKSQPCPLDLYILTNQNYRFGATVLLYLEVLKEIREQLGMDFYVFPSSQHEVLIFPKVIEMDARGLNELVRDISFSGVELEDVLDYDAYEYREKTGKLKKCSKSERER